MSSTRPPGDEQRGAELAERLVAVRARIAAAANAVGRDPAELTLVVVTKFFPASDLRELARLGVCDVGESRDQEAAAKAAELGPEFPDLRWHFIGQLQTNKVRSVAGYADVVHSVDRTKLVTALDHAALRSERDVTCFVQVDLAPALGDPPDVARGGVEPAGVLAVADAIRGSQRLRLGGLMAVAPPETDPGHAFAVLADLAATLRGQHPGAVSLSAGMSADLEAAVAAGATHLRVGGAVLGTRPAAR
ncbi:MAG: YggS family pyridoxal phosphate-dependent enzyme [Janthinobacterium lividum]